MTPDGLRAWFEDYLDVCNRHDLAGIRERLAPDVRRAHLPRGADAGPLAARSGAARSDVTAVLPGRVDAAADLFRAFPDYQWKRIAVVVEGDRLAAHLRARGTHRGSFEGVPATGRHVNVAEFGFYRIAGGRIVEYAGTAVDAELLAQLT
jgi:predicted ester cyclase